MLVVCLVCDKSYTSSRPCCPHCSKTTSEQISFSFGVIAAQNEHIRDLQDLKREIGKIRGD